jgi:uncharacterized Zn finger protein (UPF0148 family)
LICEKCGYGFVDVHRNGEGRITYCQQCGHTTEDRSDIQKQRWATRQEQLKKKAAQIEPHEKKRRHGR